MTSGVSSQFPNPESRIPNPVTGSFPRLYAIVDVDVAERHGWAPAALARVYLAAGARCLQLRAKTWGSGAFLDLCRDVVAAADEQSWRPPLGGPDSGALVIVNDRADLAAIVGADGVHVGQDDLPVSAARTLVGPHALVGLSTHTIAQVEAAVSEAVSYLAVGPAFETGTKDTGYRAVGLDFVRQAARLAGSRPLVAIGGITLDRAASVLEAGATSVAVISDLLVGDPAARVRAYLNVLKDR